MVQFFASKKHHEILFHGNKLDRITGRMMDDEIKRRQLEVRCCFVRNAHWDMRGCPPCWSLPINSPLPLPSPPIHAPSRMGQLGHSAEEMAKVASEKEKAKQVNKMEGIVVDKGEIEAGKSLI